MKLHFTFFTLWFLFILSCSSKTSNKTKGESSVENQIHVSQSLIGTSWIYQVAPECTDTIFFQNSEEVQVFYCEPGEKHFGKYSIENDTIYVDILKGQYDKDFPEGSQHRIKPYRFKLIYADSTLINLHMRPERRYVLSNN